MYTMNYSRVQEGSSVNPKIKLGMQAEHETAKFNAFCKTKAGTSTWRKLRNY